MAKLTALTPINHDGKDYDVGDQFNVTDEAQIAQLTDCGAAVVSGKRTKAEATAEATEAAAAAAAQADALAATEAAQAAPGA